MRVCRWEEYAALPEEDKVLVDCFGDVDTPLAETAHLLLRCGCDVLDKITELFNCTAALWPEWIHYDDAGSFIYADPDWATAPLTLWRTPKNQEVLRHFLCAPGPPFRLCLDSATELATAEKLWPAGDINCSNDSTCELTARIPLILDDVRWVYVQVGDECAFSVFVVSKEWAACVDQLAEWCARRQRPCAQLVRDGKRVRWKHFPQQGRTLLDEAW